MQLRHACIRVYVNQVYAWAQPAGRGGPHLAASVLAGLGSPNEFGVLICEAFAMDSALFGALLLAQLPKFVVCVCALGGAIRCSHCMC